MSLNTKEKFTSDSVKINIGRILIILAVIAVIIFAVRISFSSSKKSDTGTQPDNEPTLLFGNTEVQINPNIPVNTLTSEDFTSDDFGSVTYKGRGAKYGIDVSAFQDTIDWTAVKSSGIDFAIIRLGYRGMSEGHLYTDEYFEFNLAGAEAAGLDVGIYFFSQATSTEEAREEAEYVFDILASRKLQYPIFFDWEPGYDDVDRTKALHDSSAVNDFALEFCKAIESEGYKSGIYFNSYQGYIQYDLSLFTNQCLWLAEYDSSPEFYYAFDLWQFSHEGTVNGIATPVDVNIYFSEN